MYTSEFTQFKSLVRGRVTLRRVVLAALQETVAFYGYESERRNDRHYFTLPFACSQVASAKYLLEHTRKQPRIVASYVAHVDISFYRKE